MYVDDLVSGLLAMMTLDNFLGPVNLGNPDHELTMLDLAKKTVELCNSQSTVTFYPLPQDDPIKRRPDITLAKEKLHWEPKILLEDGLLKTIADFKIRLGL
jgi:UDP-glucuronate decarboxylase